MSDAPRHVIAAYDPPLREEVKRGLIPHFPQGEAVMHDSYGGVPLPYAQSVHEQERLRELLRGASILIVCVSGLHPNEYWAIESAVATKTPCALIVRTENRSTWASLALLHRFVTFRFVVSVGSLRGGKLRKLFPTAGTIGDISSLVEPGEQIVGYMREMAKNAHVTRFREHHTEQQGYEAFAS